ncbi:extensin family protein [Myxococcota bacterium]|nr:extensin family protein [Myxococcota bacterium]MBU1534785.1 extensin family protein [Myxococcota bacterium]
MVLKVIFTLLLPVLLIVGMVAMPGTVLSAKRHKSGMMKKGKSARGRLRGNKKLNRKKRSKKEPWNKTPELLKKVKVIDTPAPGQDVKCLARLRAVGVKFRMLKNVEAVKTPVRLLSTKLGGVHYRRAWNNKTAPWILDCKMVENLILAGPYLRRVGIASVYWTSAWRYSLVHGTKKLSRHSFGDAMDITALDGNFGYAALVSSWDSRCGGCGKGCRTAKGKALRAFICALRGPKLFATVYTPAYDALHRDHFHVDSPSPRHQLKVSINEKDLLAGSSSKKTQKVAGSAKRNHWSRYPSTRKWEAPRTRLSRW